MRTTKSSLLVASLFAGSTALLLAGNVTHAQPSDMMIDPGGTIAEPTPAPTAEAPVGNAPPASNEPATSNYYGDYLDGDLDISDDDDWQMTPVNNGVIPATHTVRRGDTLWDISAYYLRNAWDWPKVWALNPEIKDPHWIYPGNIVRLREGAAVAAMGKDLADEGQEGKAPRVVSTGRSYGLKQLAYVDIDDLKDAAVIGGSIDEKSLLSAGDSVYLNYKGNDTPKVGEEYAIYNKGKAVKREGKVVGHYVEVAGQARVTFSQEGKQARAVLLSSTNPVERGMRVGPLKLNFENVKPVANDQKVDGRIVDLIGPDELIGADAAVLVDRGKADGVKPGNRFLVIRRGDAYKKVMKPAANIGQDDEDFPARAIGEVIILQVGEQVSMGVVTFSIQEFGVGDRVFMRQGQ